MDYSAWDKELQVVTKPDGEIISLEDSKFDWARKKARTIRLARLYKKAGYQDYSRRCASCSTWLQYSLFSDGSRQLSAANFCGLRLCPLCISRKAKKAAYKLSRVLDVVEQEHGVMFLFLTLTMRNVPGSELGDAITQLTAGWNRLIQHRHVKAAIKGWFRAIEITRRSKGYHPHIHAILTVPPAYFARKSTLYISHKEWMQRWRLALRVDYDPSVRIQVAKAKGEYSGGRAAAVEAAKYAVKDEDYIDPRLTEEQASQVVIDYTRALFRRRLTAFGGVLKEAASQMDADNLDDDKDLVHIGDEGLREDVAELIETYCWRFGQGDYVLSRREPNPLYVVRE